MAKKAISKAAKNKVEEVGIYGIFNDIAQKEMGITAYLDSLRGEVAIPIPAAGRATKPFLGVLHFKKSGDGFTMKFRPYAWFVKRFDVFGIKIKADATDAPMPRAKPQKPRTPPLRISLAE